MKGGIHMTQVTENQPNTNQTQATENPIKTTILTDSLAVIGSTQQLIVSNAFQQGLSQIQPMIERTKAMLVLDIANVSDDELTTTIKDLADAQRLVKQINESKSAVKKHFNEIRDRNLEMLENALNGSGYQELTDLDKQIKKLKRDVSAHRINTRWEEMKPTFDANIAQYPIISQLAPTLTEYSRFRIRNKDLIKGGKTGFSRDKVMAFMNEQLYQTSIILEHIQKNTQNLTPINVSGVLNDFINSETIPTIDMVVQSELNRRSQEEQARKAEEARKAYEAQVKAENERKQRELAEQQRKQQEAQEQAKQAQQNNATQPVAPTNPTTDALNNHRQPAQQTQTQQTQAVNQTQQPKQTMFTQTEAFARPQATDTYKWVADMIFAVPQFRDIHTNPMTKMSVMYHMWTQVAIPNTQFNQNVLNEKGAVDPEKVLALSDYIRSL